MSNATEKPLFTSLSQARAARDRLAEDLHKDIAEIENETDAKKEVDAICSAGDGWRSRIAIWMREFESHSDFPLDLTYLTELQAVIAWIYTEERRQCAAQAPSGRAAA